MIRGINANSQVLSQHPEFVAELVSWGINHVHVQIEDVGGATISASNYDHWIAAQCTALDPVIASLGSKGIKTSLAIYSSPDGMDGASHAVFTKSAPYQALLDAWAYMVRRYKGNPNLHSFDLLNEPAIGGSVTRTWRDVAQALVKEIAIVDPTRRIMLTPLYGNPDLLPSIAPVIVSNGNVPITVNIHFYRPERFTYQDISQPHLSSSWPIPGKWDAAFLAKQLASTVVFQKQYNVPVVVTEFSASKTAAGATNYFKDLLNILESYKWGHCYHVFKQASCWDLETGEPTRLAMLKSFWAKN